jgi:hypothetical protein
MGTASPAGTTRLAPRSINRLVLRASTISVLVVAVINLGVYALGRTTEASFVVSPSLGPQDLQVDAIKVAATTLIYFAPGVVLLALAARRSLRWIRILAVAAALFAIGSTWGPLDAAHDSATGWALAPMHWTTGAAFVVAATWVHKRLAADLPR